MSARWNCLSSRNRRGRRHSSRLRQHRFHHAGRPKAGAGDRHPAAHAHHPGAQTRHPAARAERVVARPAPCSRRNARAKSAGDHDTPSRSSRPSRQPCPGTQHSPVSQRSGACYSAACRSASPLHAGAATSATQIGVIQRNGEKGKPQKGSAASAASIRIEAAPRDGNSKGRPFQIAYKKAHDKRRQPPHARLQFLELPEDSRGVEPPRPRPSRRASEMQDDEFGRCAHRILSPIPFYCITRATCLSLGNCDILSPRLETPGQSVAFSINSQKERCLQSSSGFLFLPRPYFPPGRPLPGISICPAGDKNSHGAVPAVSPRGSKKEQEDGTACGQRMRSSISQPQFPPS